jgi:hypothetical protein
MRHFFLVISVLLLASLFSILPSLELDQRTRDFTNVPSIDDRKALQATAFVFGPVVHIVVTRFMQHQPTLVELGSARLALFRAFCLPTMIQQSNQNFLWVIQTDPHLDSTLMQEMVSLLQPHSHFFLLLSNDNGQNFRRQAVNESLVASGDVALLSQARKLSEDHIFIETRIDADDGINLRLLQNIQHVSIQRLSNPPVNSASRWLVFCIDRHFEWHNADESPEGVLVLVSEAICVTPGLSFAMAPEVSRDSLPKGAHNRLVYKASTCKTQNETACIYRMYQIHRAAAIRARTTTSAGMANIGKTFEKNSSTKLFWDAASIDLGIDKGDVINAKAYLDVRKVDIARENLDGQWYVKFRIYCDLLLMNSLPS